MISPTARTERRSLPSQPSPRTATQPRKTDSYGNPISLIPERRENAAGVEGPNQTVTARIGTTTISIESRGAIGVKQLIPIPTVPGLGATGGLKINTTTGKIEQVSVGVSYINLVSVDFALEGCNVIITISAGMPGTVTFINTSQTHAIPGCVPETVEPPQEPIEELDPWQPPPPDFEGLDPFDPATFPPLPPKCSYIIGIVWPERQSKVSPLAKAPNSEGEYCKFEGYYVQYYSAPVPVSVYKLALKLQKSAYRSDFGIGFQAASGQPGVPFYDYSIESRYNEDGIPHCRNPKIISKTLKHWHDWFSPLMYGSNPLWSWDCHHAIHVVPPYYLDRWIKTYVIDYTKYYKFPIQIVEVGSTCGVLPADEPKEPKFKPSPQKPGFQPTKRKMDECCKALGRQIEEIHAVLSADKFPYEIPQYLSNRGKSIKIGNYWEGLIDLYLKLDDLMGEFPIKLKITTDEGQEKEEELVTVADALADIYQLSVATYYDADNVFSLCIKIIELLIETRLIAKQTYDISFVTNEQLGFEIERKPVKEELPIDPRYPDDWVKYNTPWKPEEPNGFEWKNRDDATLKAYLLELTKLAVTSAAGVSIKGKPHEIVDRVAKTAELMRRIVDSPDVIDAWIGKLTKLSRKESATTPEIIVSEE